MPSESAKAMISMESPSALQRESAKAVEHSAGCSQSPQASTMAAS
jgi:hypothetical protein